MNTGEPFGISTFSSFSIELGDDYKQHYIEKEIINTKSSSFGSTTMLNFLLSRFSTGLYNKYPIYILLLE